MYYKYFIFIFSLRPIATTDDLRDVLIYNGTTRKWVTVDYTMFCRLPCITLGIFQHNDLTIPEHSGFSLNFY